MRKELINWSANPEAVKYASHAGSGDVLDGVEGGSVSKTAEESKTEESRDDDKEEEEDSFKAGFITRCLEEGLTADEIEKRAATKIAIPVGAAIGGGAALLGAAGGLAGAIPAVASVPLIAGYPLYHLGRVAQTSLHDQNKKLLETANAGQRINPRDFQNLELIDEYNRMADDIERREKDRAVAAAMPPSRSKTYF